MAKCEAKSWCGGGGKGRFKDEPFFFQKTFFESRINKKQHANCCSHEFLVCVCCRFTLSFLRVFLVVNCTFFKLVASIDVSFPGLRWAQRRIRYAMVCTVSFGERVHRMYVTHISYMDDCNTIDIYILYTHTRTANCHHEIAFLLLKNTSVLLLSLKLFFWKRWSPSVPRPGIKTPFSERHDVTFKFTRQLGHLRLTCCVLRFFVFSVVNPKLDIQNRYIEAIFGMNVSKSSKNCHGWSKTGLEMMVLSTIYLDLFFFVFFLAFCHLWG